MDLNLRGKLTAWDRPVVMGILNLSPDSFHASSRTDKGAVAHRVAAMVADGADIIDLGGCSTRPGASEVSPAEELDRLAPSVAGLREAFPALPISVDTYRAEVAAECVRLGADIVNDISGGTLDPEMFPTVARLKVAYIAGHLRGTPSTMQNLTDYDDVVAEVLEDLARKADRLHQAGVCDVIIDPCFGFAKTLDQNYRLLAGIAALKRIGCPVLAGVSRKSMITKELGITPGDALNGTTVINTIALLNGADILRVHDVKQAREVLALVAAYRRNLSTNPHIITTI